MAISTVGGKGGSAARRGVVGGTAARQALTEEASSETVCVRRRPNSDVAGVAFVHFQGGAG